MNNEFANFKQEMQKEFGTVNWSNVFNPSAQKTMDEWMISEAWKITRPTPQRICAITGKTK